MRWCCDASRRRTPRHWEGAAFKTHREPNAAMLAKYAAGNNGTRTTQAGNRTGNNTRLRLGMLHLATEAIEQAVPRLLAVVSTRLRTTRRWS
jgi:hypothetical protein